jgi:pimeloyl-ACP methyl ester carboxylesterase
MERRIIILLVILLCSIHSFAQSPIKYNTVLVGNIKQVISYSANENLPLILFLHGGPGSSRMKQAEVFSNVLQEHFIVVQWDQRDAGRTLALNKSTIPITLELMETDTYEVIKLLLKKFNQKKLFLVGESFGTVSGFRIAQKYPELLNAYIAFSPVVNQEKSEQILLDKLKIDAKEKGNDQAQKELGTVKIPYGDQKQMNYAKKWMLIFDGHPLTADQITAFDQYMKDWSDTWLQTWNKAMGQNLFTALPRINCPVYFFLGKKDLQTNFGIAKEYSEFLKAPKKEVFIFENAGHSVLTEEADQVQKIIINEILNKGVED